MIQNFKQLDVYLHDHLVGQLDYQNDQIGFGYVPDTPDTYALSYSMPVVKNSNYDDTVCRAYFGGLLPEEDERSKLNEYYKVPNRNDFRLLEIIGEECAGAVSLKNPESNVPQIPSEQRDLVQIPKSELENIFSELNNTPLLATQGQRLSLAGAQKKMALTISDGKYYLPYRSHISTHILKPQHARHKTIVDNEFFCMRLLKTIDPTTPKVSILKLSEDKKVFVIQRYDRYIEDQKQRRYHQEDFAQALGVVSGDKYDVNV